MPAAKYLNTRNCEVCKTSFMPKTITSRYCCKKCSDVAWKRKKDKQKKIEAMDAAVGKIPEARDYISIPEAIAMFGIGKNTLYRLIRNGVIPSINIGQRLTRISKTELLGMFPIRDSSPVPDKPQPKLYSLEPEDCYTIGEIAEKFRVNDSTVYKQIRKYSIPTRQIGNYVYVPKTEIDNLYK
ncbi:MAG: helix-turn-helix domain-containing protein [Phocaeicola sp.]